MGLTTKDSNGRKRKQNGTRTSESAQNKMVKYKRSSAISNVITCPTAPQNIPYAMTSPPSPRDEVSPAAGGGGGAGGGGAGGGGNGRGGGGGGGGGGGPPGPPEPPGPNPGVHLEHPNNPPLAARIFEFVPMAAVYLYPRPTGPGDEVLLAQTPNPPPVLHFLGEEFYQFNTRTEDGPVLWPAAVETAYVFPANLGPNTVPGGRTENQLEQTMPIELHTRTEAAAQTPANLLQVPEPGTTAEDRRDELSSQAPDRSLHDRPVIPPLPHLVPVPVHRPERPAASAFASAHLSTAQLLEDAGEITAPLPGQTQSTARVHEASAVDTAAGTSRDPPSANSTPPLARVPDVFGSCWYCYRMPPDSIFIPCGHKVACHYCAIRVAICANCTREVNCFVKVYKA